tara:strand:- start:1152 stop:1766 length:615 start_codon:yes stop_codon:yes gene_type:complete
MKIKTPDFLKNKIVLYVVFILAITNVLGFLNNNDFESLTFFIVIGLLSTYFSKNMTVNLLIALIATNVVFASKKVYEGMRSKKRSRKGKKGKKEKYTQRNIPRSKPKSVSRDDRIGERIDYASTVEQAYDNLSEMLGKDGVRGLTKETKLLVDQQKELMGNLKDMGPLIKTAQSAIKSMPQLGEINKLMAPLQGTIKQLKGMKK